MNAPSDRFWVYLVEDDESVLKSLLALLGAHGFQTVGCESAEQFLEVFDPQLKACLVLDLRLPGMSGTQLQSRLRDLRLNIPIIIVTAHGDLPVAVQAMRDGAIDFIEKPAEEKRLLESIRTASDILSNRKPPLIPRNVVDQRLAKLTEREREVLDHLLQGKLNKEIAGDLDVSPRTIEVHRARIREKMHARGIADLIRMLG